MFSSLASFIFGSNTSATTNCEANQNPTRQEENDQPATSSGDNNVRIDAEHTIEVTSLTPSVTGCGSSNNVVVHPGKRGGKNKRNRNKNSKKQGLNVQQQGREDKSATPSLTKLLTPSESFDDEFDEDDWFIVEKEEDVEEDSLPRTDSEEELSIVEVKAKSVTPTPSPTNRAAERLRRQHQHQHPHPHQHQHPHITSHSLYSGPRPQQQRNLLQRARTNGARFSVAALSPPRSISDVGLSADSALADGGITQSLYVVSPSREAHNGSGGSNGANISMEESWFVTPPPCFTSIGPINMETSPFENLLIEHPSMSVYHSIRSAQEAAESFVNLDLGVDESQQTRRVVTSTALPAAGQNNGRNTQAVQERTAGARVNRYSSAQLKQELFERSYQKSHDKKERRENLRRGAIQRANKVRDFQSKGNRQRRSDMQHCKVISGANNNRKCYF